MKTGNARNSAPTTDVVSSLTNVVRAGAGRCVACGMCLPHCPTYKKTKSELESPRGRLSLMLALDKGELEPSAKLESHLSLCLLCRACETVCPAGVPFGDVMDATRARLQTDRPASFARRMSSLALVSLAQPRWARLSATLLRFYQRSGLQTALRITGMLRLSGLKELDAELPPLARYLPLATHYRTHCQRRGTVALFTGCVARLTDAETLHSAVRVLTALGYDVQVPANQSCCGALHRHGGDARRADELMRRNIEAFVTDDVEAIITTASGCAATLVEYQDAAGNTFAKKVVDISAFVANLTWPAEVVLRPLPKRIAVHDPCTLVNVLRSRQAPYTLLKKIPDAAIVALPGNNQCCGAAGAYHLEHPQMAHTLRDDKIESLRRQIPDILATSNIGCAMHIAAGIRAAGLSVEMAHPITLLARQLDGKAV